MIGCCKDQISLSSNAADANTSLSFEPEKVTGSIDKSVPLVMSV